MGDIIKFKPRKIVHDVELNERLNTIIKKHKKHIPSGWKIVIVDQRAGHCYYDYSYITIPTWVFNDKRCGVKYFEYYLCHELSHIDNAKRWVNNNRSCYKVHGQEFMEQFKMICPKRLQHHELDYQPRAARAAGISRPKSKTTK